ncbi:MAG: M50 family metallopeptidase [Chloroflexota bacterium]
MPDFIGVGNGLINIVLLVLILVPLVVIHEFGHFIVARRAGVTVHEFGIGFPPRAKTLGTDSKGTTYTLNWLPLGGFVRLEGEDGESVDKNAFVNQRLPTRLAILLAGVTMNLLLAFVILTGIALFADPAVDVQLTCVQPDGPAALAGLKSGIQTGTITGSDGRQYSVCDPSGESITAIDGQRFLAFSEPSSVDAIGYLRAHAGQTVTLSVRGSDGIVRDVSVSLRPPAEAADKGALGITGYDISYSTEPHDALTAVALGARRTVDAATLVLHGLGDFINNLGSPPISGPVGIANTIGIVRTALPPVFLIWLVAVLSANLAVVNVLPFPPLDGGKVATSLIQAVVGDRANRLIERVVYAGLLLMLFLIVWVTLFDVGILQRT